MVGRQHVGSRAGSPEQSRETPCEFLGSFTRLGVHWEAHAARTGTLEVWDLNRLCVYLLSSSPPVFRISLDTNGRTCTRYLLPVGRELIEMNLGKKRGPARATLMGNREAWAKCKPAQDRVSVRRRPGLPPLLDSFRILSVCVFLFLLIDNASAVQKKLLRHRRKSGPARSSEMSPVCVLLESSCFVLCIHVHAVISLL